MAPGLSATAANSMLAVLEGYEYIQLHIGDPGPAGTANIAAESTRNLVEWDAPSGGVVAITTDITITTVAATEQWTYFTAWSLLTGGTFGASGVCSASPVTLGDNVVIAAESVTFTFPLAS